MQVYTVENREETLRRVSNFLFDLFSSCLGPSGKRKLMKKKVKRSKVTKTRATCDGLSIVKHILQKSEDPVISFVLKSLLEQGNTMKDGVCTTALLVAEMLSECCILLERKMHPIRISTFFKLALHKASKIFSENTKEIEEEEISQIISNSFKLSPTVTWKEKEKLSKYCLMIKEKFPYCEKEEVLKKVTFVKEIDIFSKFSDCEFLEGIIFERESGFTEPNVVLDNSSPIKLIVVSQEICFPKIKTKHSLNMEGMQAEEMMNIEEKYAAELVSKVLEWKVKVIFCQWKIDSKISKYFSEKGVHCLSWISGDLLEKIALASGANICSDLLSIREKHVREVSSFSFDKFENKFRLRVETCSEEKELGMVTFLVRGKSENECHEFKENIKKGICVSIEERNSLYTKGKGFCHFHFRLYEAVRASLMKDRVDHVCQEEVMVKWANSLLVIPRTILANKKMGGKSIERIKRINQGKDSADKDEVFEGIFSQEFPLTFEQAKTTFHAIRMATETVCMLLKVD